MDSPTRRQRKSTPLKSLLPKLMKPAQTKRGFYEQRILLEWPSIVGTVMAARCIPIKISYDSTGRQGARLHLLVEPAWAIEVQYMENIILEKIAVFFGYRAIDRIVINQAPLPKTQLPSTMPPAPQAVPSARAREMLAAVEDDELRHALEKLAAVHESKSNS